jgi:hypothetical protein
MRTLLRGDGECRRDDTRVDSEVAANDQSAYSLAKLPANRSVNLARSAWMAGQPSPGLVSGQQLVSGFRLSFRWLMPGHQCWPDIHPANESQDWRGTVSCLRLIDRPVIGHIFAANRFWPRTSLEFWPFIHRETVLARTEARAHAPDLPVGGPDVTVHDVLEQLLLA